MLTPQEQELLDNVIAYLGLTIDNLEMARTQLEEIRHPVGDTEHPVEVSEDEAEA